MQSWLRSTVSTQAHLCNFCQRYIYWILTSGGWMCMCITLFCLIFLINYNYILKVSFHFDINSLFLLSQCKQTQIKSPMIQCCKNIKRWKLPMGVNTFHRHCIWLYVGLWLLNTILYFLCKHIYWITAYSKISKFEIHRTFSYSRAQINNSKEYI